MSNVSTKRTIPRFQKKTEYYDYSLVAVMILLIVFGLIMLYSTSSYVAQLHEGNDMFYFRKQALISAASIGCSLILSQFDYHLLGKIPSLIYSAAMVLMIMVKITPFGVEVNGAKRWLNFGGLQFQPSEIAKIAAIVTISFMIVQMGKKAAEIRGIEVLLGAGGALGLVTFVFTDNLSTAIIIWGITCILIFIARPRTKPFIIIFVCLAAVAAAAVLILTAAIDTSSNFRIRRILTWLRPEEYSASGGFQVMQGLYAIGSGGFFGKGLGNSAQKLGWIPEAQNDMIFSIICEELGIFGASIILLLFVYLLYRLIFIAQNAPDLFGSLLVSGVFVHIALQVVFNICVVTNLIPTTGITLPFFSYGGTSILFLMSEMGIALSVARHIKFQGEA